MDLGFLISLILILVALAMGILPGMLPDEMEKAVFDFLQPIGQWWLDLFPYPVLTTILMTYIFIWYVINPIKQRIGQKEEFKHFKSDIQDLRDKNKIFFPLLEKAYQKWRKRNELKYPHENINEFIDSIDYPSWLRKRYKDLQKISNQNIDRSSPEWAFVFDLYIEIENVRNNRAIPNLLSTKDEYETFHDIRIEIDKFWIGVSEKIHNGELAYADIKEKIQSQHRTLKLIPLIAVVFHQIHNQKGPEGYTLYMLAYRFYKKSIYQNMKNKLCQKANTTV